MVAYVLVCAGLLGFVPDDRSEYQAAAARAGRDAGAQLKLAVWCEAHGLQAERLQHLAKAVVFDPRNPAVRGMLGLVEYGGKWLPPAKVGDAVRSDEATSAKLAEYEARRQNTPQFAQAQWDLAVWCEQNGLKAEAMAHFTAVTQIDPKRGDAWRKLGCELSHGKWIPREQADAIRDEEDAQRDADRYWEPILLRRRQDLDVVGPRREAAVEALGRITDPRAVPMIHKVLARGTKAQQEMAAQMLGRIQCPASSHALAALALYEAWPQGRSFAIEELKRRDPREYMDELVARMHRPFKYTVNPPGATGALPTLVIEGDQMELHRVYRNDAALRRRATQPVLTAPPIGIGVAPTGQPVAGIERFLGANPAGGFNAMGPMPLQQVAMVARENLATEQAMQREIATVENFNTRIREDNRVVGATLTELTGQQLGEDPEAWRSWWNDKLGVRYERTESRYKKPTVQLVRIPFILHHSCFAAGTPVPTLTGPRPIESLKLGDLVLSQDTTTGVLSYQPIVGVHHNPPAETVRVRLTAGSVVSTPVHRFWRAGRGWAMARDLKPGETIRTVGGRAEVVEVTPEPVQPVFNLDVAKTHSFFVGSPELLVRDSSLPPAMYTPFDAEPSLALLKETEQPAAQPEKRGDKARAPSMLGKAVEVDPIWGTDRPPAPTVGKRPGAKAAAAAATGSVWETPGAAPADRDPTPGAAPRKVEYQDATPR